MKSSYDIIREAVFTERTTQLAEESDIYTFKVTASANKVEIKEAVEIAFNVKVDSVRTINVHPKQKMDRYRGIRGKSTAYKKALVKLVKGHKIEFV
jgi:large subunit ribosomal protein L23